jgi:Family of unknown function (DUF6174)
MHVIAIARKALVAFVMTFCTLAGCQSSSPTDGGGISLDLSKAERRWQESGLTNYDFVSTSLCYCSTDYVGPLHVSVRNGAVTAIVNTRTGVAAPLRYRNPVDSVFAFVRLEQTRRPINLTVTYDAVLGYPRRIEYGTLANDDGGVITIENLRAALP